MLHFGSVLWQITSRQTAVHVYRRYINNLAALYGAAGCRISWCSSIPVIGAISSLECRFLIAISMFTAQVSLFLLFLIFFLRLFMFCLIEAYIVNLFYAFV
jgi:hypothetical protein